MARDHTQSVLIRGVHLGRSQENLPLKSFYKNVEITICHKSVSLVSIYNIEYLR